MLKYPRKIATLTGQGGRRVVTVYETAKGHWRVYLKVDGRFVASERAPSRSAALGSAKAWT